MCRKLLVLILVLGFVGSVQAALVHEWEFEGNASDTSGSGNTGTITGTASYVDGVDYWKVSSGQAIYLNGSTKVEDLAASNLPQASTGAYSIRSPSWSENVYVTLEGNTGLDWKNAAGFGRYSSSEGRFMVTRYQNVYLSTYTNDCAMNAYITDTKWHMITATYWQNSADPVRGNIFMYYDGAYDSGRYGATLLDTVDDIQVGYYTRSGANYWVGKIDGFQIYNHVLDQDEIDTLYERIPEPATIALLGLGGLVLLRKRR
jgi:hypothetical protein